MRSFSIVLSTVLLWLVLPVNQLSAQKSITLEDIWAKGTFSTRNIPGFSFTGTGREYILRKGPVLEKYDLSNGESTGILLDGNAILDKEGKPMQYSNYVQSPDSRYFILETQAESIYRYSVKARYLLWDSRDKILVALDAPEAQMYPTFSPDSRNIAFVSQNNLFVYSIETQKSVAVTTNGQVNSILNGASDWVYEEEFSITRAFEWSLDSRYLAFIRFDESQVPSFLMEMYQDSLYPTPVVFKYPKVGEKNAVVSLHLYDLRAGKYTDLSMGDMEDRYIPRIKWSKEGLVAFRMNRHQNELDLLLFDPSTQQSRILLKEQNSRYIDIHDDLTFLKDKSWFIWSSEQDGYQHLYLYDMKGRLIRPLTSGSFDVTAFYGVDEKNGFIYYQAAKESPMERHIYEVSLQGGKERKITPLKGWNSVQFSPDFDYFVNTHSTIHSAPSYTVCNRAGEIARVIEENKRITELQQEFGVVKPEFFTITTSEQVSLNAFWIKPTDFDPAKKYPVFMFLYGGPNSQQVTDSWKNANYWWFQMLAQKGYIVACVDNRGTGGRGEDFRKITYLKLGHYETIDQIEAASYLAGLPYVDGSRIGIFGWSYGGYMSSLCLLKGADVFKAAIAVAPVTNWKWYDTIYTERYMRTEKENQEGYKQNSPVYFADRLKGKYLLVHGMADDNVHFQHTVEMANALIKANKQFDTYFYPNKNHGIYGGTARIHLYTKMTQFILDNL
jgi:dipeptidyl-peptidase 4